MSFSSAFSATVIVPIYNHWHLVPTLLEHLARQTLGTNRFEVILIDNGSSHIPEIPLPTWSRLLHCTAPGSYAARNVGVRAARSELLVFTDADCQPRPQWLDQLVAAAGRESTRALVAGGVSMEPFDWRSTTRSEIFDVVMGLPQERYVRHGYAVTANLLVPALAFNEVGLFDENRFSGGDAEFCRRAITCGWELHFCPKAEIIHPARRSWEEIRTKHRRVKGGQLSAGPWRRRLLYGVMTLTPPLRQAFFALRSRRVGVMKRIEVCGMLIGLWGVGVVEMVRIVLGAPPERR